MTVNSSFIQFQFWGVPTARPRLSVIGEKSAWPGIFCVVVLYEPTRYAMTSTWMFSPDTDMKPRLMALPLFGRIVTLNLKLRSGSDAKCAIEDDCVIGIVVPYEVVTVAVVVPWNCDRLIMMNSAGLASATATDTLTTPDCALLSELLVESHTTAKEVSGVLPARTPCCMSWVRYRCTTDVICAHRLASLGSNKANWHRAVRSCTSIWIVRSTEMNWFG